MISLLYPSRQRPHKARKTYMDWIANSTTEIETILSLDSDDPTLSTYKELFPDVTIIVNRNRSLVDATNTAAKESTGDLIIVLSDDMECFKDWDVTILEAVVGKSNFLLKTHDGAQDWIVTLHICDRLFYESLGYIYPLHYSHLFADTEVTHIADCTGRLIVRNDIKFMHNNPCYKRQGSDEVNRKAMRTQATGERTYIKRVRDNFNLQGIDVMNLNEFANDHKMWLRKRGIR